MANAPQKSLPFFYFPPSGKDLGPTNKGPVQVSSSSKEVVTATTTEKMSQAPQSNPAASVPPSISPPRSSSQISPNDIGLGGFAITKTPEDGDGVGALAPILEPAKSGWVNVHKEYPWTITPTKNRDDVPYIHLYEYRVEGGAIGKQVNFYINGITGAFNDVVGASNVGHPTAVYDAIFLRDAKLKTGWEYRFPYFTKSQYELATAAWEKFDKIGQSVSGIASGMSSMFNAALMTRTGKAFDLLGKTIDFAGAAAETALKGMYPLVNISDRPRVFTNHNERSITITFPLLNTIHPDDWIKNRQFLTVFQYQNLFNKRNFITGLPPVWYTVYVPSQYYSIASCVTNIRVENLGNIRVERTGNLLNQNGFREFLVPDAYQVEITLQEMAMPSQNQFLVALQNNPDVHAQIQASEVQQPTPPLPTTEYNPGSFPGSVSPSEVVPGLGVPGRF